MAQQMAMQHHQAQAQAQNQHLVQGNTPGQPMQMTPQQLQNLQTQQAQIAAATMQTQASGQGQQHPGQRPQPQAQPQPGPQNPPGSQPQTQAGTPAPSGGQQTPAQTPGPAPAPQAQPQQPQNQQVQQSQPQLQNAAVAAAQQQAQLNAAAAHQAAVANNMALQQRRAEMRAEMRSHCLLRLMQFSEYLSGFPVSFFLFGHTGPLSLLLLTTKINRVQRAKAICRIGTNLLTDSSRPRVSLGTGSISTTPSKRLTSSTKLRSPRWRDTSIRTSRAVSRQCSSLWTREQQNVHFLVTVIG